ncbi:MAG: EAL domain-containing protein [Sulfurospirillaceae bacterium]|nr:EAL domain-containing protein [Sulfurospirillaceae bacterium]
MLFFKIKSLEKVLKKSYEIKEKSIQKSIKPIILILLLLAISILSPVKLQASIEKTININIGVLAYRSKDATYKQWDGFLKSLQEHLPHYHFELFPMTLKEMDNAVKNKKIDFVITNSGHYIWLKKTFGLPYPFATMIETKNNKEINSFGGVIFTLKSNHKIQTLKDIINKKVAFVSKEAFGGYIMELYELKKRGISFSKSAKLIPTGMPQDRVVYAVLKKEADVGFVRAGVLESLAHEHKIDMKEFKIINEQKSEELPFALSTDLYPLWPISAMPSTDKKIVNIIAGTILSMGNDVSKSNEKQRFGIAANYDHVEEILKKLKIAPFNNLQKIRLKDILKYYENEILAFLIIVGLMLIFGLVRLYIINSRLKDSQKRVKALLEGSFSGIIIHNKGTILECNERMQSISGYSHAELIGMDGLKLISEQYVEDVKDKITTGYTKPYEVIGIKKDGTLYPVRLEAKLMPYDGKIVRAVEFRDITEEKKSQEKLYLAASVFSHAREGIVIVNTDGTIMDINDAFTYITGYSKSEVVGEKISILKSGVHDEVFYKRMWNDLTTKGHWYGEIWNKRKNGEIYAEMLTISTIFDKKNVPKQFVAIFSDITFLKEHEEQLEYIAHHDALTNLPNRLLLSERLQRALIETKRNNHLVAVLFLDLDGFKTINDRFGHEIGDDLLVEISNEMKKTLREEDTLARLGGDEFVIVLQNIVDTQMCIPMLKRLLEVVNKPILCGNIMLKVSASVGVTFYPQSEVVEADQLIRQADQAMYQAKLSGKNRYHIFDEQEDKNVRGNYANIEDIRKAFEHKEFILYYQPKVDMRTGEIIGFEALIRWKHPTKGILPPAIFLPVIEEHVLSIDVGKWVIRNAFEQVRTWQKEGINVNVSINVNAKQLLSHDFIEFLEETIRLYKDVSPANIELEILETSALQDLARVSKLIKEAKKLGFKFSLDDFGTGYSSLIYLKKLPIDLLKIDQSFVRDMLDDPNDFSILDGILGLANAFNQKVIAEGVETLAHGVMLIQMGCKYAQGYGIAKPMSAENVKGWVDSWKLPEIWRNTILYDREDFPILHAIVRHRSWIDMLENYVYKRSPFMPQMNSTDCSFGQWLQQEGLEHFGKDLLEPIFMLHNKLHDASQKLCDECKYQSIENLSESLAEIYRHRDDMIMMLNRLKRNPKD